MQLFLKLIMLLSLVVAGSTWAFVLLEYDMTITINEWSCDLPLWVTYSTMGLSACILIWSILLHTILGFKSSKSKEKEEELTVILEALNSKKINS